jgi:hypothetical protein
MVDTQSARSGQKVGSFAIVLNVEMTGRFIAIPRKRDAATEFA